eukprot:scaffold323_cov414-Prasinococcus_capsulatus_cf.AAC.43
MVFGTRTALAVLRKNWRSGLVLGPRPRACPHHATRSNVAFVGEAAARGRWARLAKSIACRYDQVWKPIPNTQTRKANRRKRLSAVQEVQELLRQLRDVDVYVKCCIRVRDRLGWTARTYSSCICCGCSAKGVKTSK